MISNLQESSFNILEIDSKILLEKGEFIQKKISPKNIPYENIIKLIPTKNEEKSENLGKYFCKITFPFTYIGILNNNLKREKYGYSLLDNGDQYLGEYKNDIKEGFGIYKYKYKQNNEEIEEIYIGNYKNNEKQGKGMYITISKSLKDDSTGDIILVNYKTFFGFFENNLIKNGIIFSIKNDEEYFYKGKINILGEPEDDDALIIENKNKIFKGKIIKGNMIEGRNIFINNNYEKIKGYYFNKEDDLYKFDEGKKEENDEECIKIRKNYDEINYGKIIKDIYNEIYKAFEKMKIYEYAINVDFDNDIIYNIKNNLNKIIQE